MALVPICEKLGIMGEDKHSADSDDFWHSGFSPKTRTQPSYSRLRRLARGRKGMNGPTARHPPRASAEQAWFCRSVGGAQRVGCMPWLGGARRHSAYLGLHLHPLPLTS